jgi:hypothetical protein
VREKGKRATKGVRKCDREGKEKVGVRREGCQNKMRQREREWEWEREGE